MNLPEQVQEAQILSRELNVKDLESRLTQSMKEIGFNQVSEQEVGKIHNELCQEDYSILDLVNGHAISNPPCFYVYKGFHDETDILIYRGNKSNILIGKKPVYVPGYWRSSWGLDIMTLCDLSDTSVMDEKQVEALPPNAVVLDRLSGGDTNISIVNAFEVYQPHATGILYIHPHFAFHQYINFRKPTTMQASGEEFVQYITDWTTKLIRINSGWIENQLKVRNSMVGAEYAFQLLMRNL